MICPPQFFSTASSNVLQSHPSSGILCPSQAASVFHRSSPSFFVLLRSLLLSSFPSFLRLPSAFSIRFRLSTTLSVPSSLRRPSQAFYVFLRPSSFFLVLLRPLQPPCPSPASSILHHPPSAFSDLLRPPSTLVYPRPATYCDCLFWSFSSSSVFLRSLPAFSDLPRPLSSFSVVLLLKLEVDRF